MGWLGPASGGRARCQDPAREGSLSPGRTVARSHARCVAPDKLGGGCNRSSVRHLYVPNNLDRPPLRCLRKAPRPAPGSGGSAAGVGDPAEQLALVARSKRDVLLGANGLRLRREDLEDCFSQATLELVAYVR